MTIRSHSKVIRLIILEMVCLVMSPGHDLAAEDFHQTRIVDIRIPDPVWSAEQKSHWSFQPVENVKPPKVENRHWSRNTIDLFILKQMEELDFQPSQAADRETLLRRLTFDLTGLPPTPEEIDSFLDDTRSDAYERRVDELLDRQSYGEKWARWWLDLARYAESDGFKADDIRPNAWRYRDWVIQAFNKDMPYDEFIALQLAGDEIRPNDPDAFIATGLNRLYPFENNNMVPGLNRQLILDDITDTNASLFLGLTVACARCHDHKFDPISQKDYYRFEALFGGLSAEDQYPIGSGMEVALKSTLQIETNARKELIESAMNRIEQKYWADALQPVAMKLGAETRKSLAKPPERRTSGDITTIRNSMKSLKVSTEQVVSMMDSKDRSQWTRMKSGLDKIRKTSPHALPTASGMADHGKVAEPVRLLIKGNFHVQSEVVPPGFLSVLSHETKITPKATGHSTTGTRSELVRWLTDPENPLTARVIVNRIWQQHFGRGIVSTTSDFGTQGMEPSHPALLDWLALELIRSGWSFKHMHRLMVTSATYRLSSQPTPNAVRDDPDNLLFSFHHRHRIDAEMVRDSILAVSGQLNPAYGGPSVRPPLPDGITAKDWITDKDPQNHLRRSIYIFAQRNVRHPLLEAFDQPDSNLTCPERLVSINAPQALILLNSDFIEEQSMALADRILAMKFSNDEERMLYLWKLCLGRSPSSEEARTLNQTYQDLCQKQNQDSSRSQSQNEEWTVDDSRKSVWASICHVVLNLNEFVFVD